MEEGRGGGRGGGLAAAQGQSGEGAAWVLLGWFFPTGGAAPAWSGVTRVGGRDAVGGCVGGLPTPRLGTSPPCCLHQSSHGRENRSGEAENKLKNKSGNLLESPARLWPRPPPPGSAPSALPAPQPRLWSLAASPAWLGGSVPPVGCRGAGAGGVVRGWVVPPRFARGEWRCWEGRRDNRLLCSYLWRPELGWGFALRSSNQCSQFLPVAVERQPWTWVDGQEPRAASWGGGECSELATGHPEPCWGRGTPG